MNETLKTILLAMIPMIPAYYLLFSQRRKNASEADASIADAAAKLNKQTIEMLASQSSTLDAANNRIKNLETKVDLLEQQVKAERRATRLYKQYINYLLSGIKQLTGQLDMLKQPPAFDPMTLEAFETVDNL